MNLLVSTACLWEATARKVGNVHRHADFATTTLMDFLLSAVAIAESLTSTQQAGWGARIEAAVGATRDVVGQNTNLGIILLLTPLAAALQTETLRESVARVLRELTVEDARRVYSAIRLANPGGLGAASEQDVREEPNVTLREAMTLAAGRDRIASQYAHDFQDIFDFGVPAFLEGYARFRCIEAAIIDCQLHWLAEFKDSLIARKRGDAAALDVQQRVRDVLRLGGLTTIEGRRAGRELDGYLRSDGNALNPGTTADLVTACLFVALRENKVQPSSPFRWDAPDWLAP